MRAFDRVALLAVLAAFGCGGSTVGASTDGGAGPLRDGTAGDSPAVGQSEAGPVDAAATDAGSDDGGFAVCPPGIDPTFTSILSKMLATSGCGSDSPYNCHSASGASPAGTGNLLDFSADAATVYAELLGADGGGREAVNLAGVARVQQVVPGDASASFLYIKLLLKTGADYQYGAGMPLQAPGSVCPAAIDAVRQWIEQGAAAN
jgi:hypothetical protein